MQVIARLGSGVNLDQAHAEMDGITAQLAREYPKEDGSTFVAMGSLREKIVGPIRPLLIVLFGAVGFVLLIACANVANLLMTRSIDRRKEFAYLPKVKDFHVDMPAINGRRPRRAGWKAMP